MPDSWESGWNGIRWNEYWQPSSLYNVSEVGILTGHHKSGSLVDLNEENGNYTMSSESSKLSAIFYMHLDFSNEKKIGSMPYTLSQAERIAAFKMQSMVSVNDTTDIAWYNFTYELYNETGAKWVTCNWDGSRYWEYHDSQYGYYKIKILLSFLKEGKKKYLFILKKFFKCFFYERKQR